MKTCRLGFHQWTGVNLAKDLWQEEGMLYDSTRLLTDISDLYKYNSSKVVPLKLIKGKKK